MKYQKKKMLPDSGRKDNLYLLIAHDIEAEMHKDMLK